MNSQELKLDHFLFYDVANQPAGQIVGLQGQFDKQPEKNKLTSLNLFANWARKNGEPVYDKHAHLTWYDLYDPVPDPMRLVYFKNQFGEQKVITGRAVALLAPAQKIDRGSKFPRELDHFKVYQVLEGSPVGKTVALDDQFTKLKTDVGYPYAFAVPVMKWHMGEKFKIHNEKAHLVLYRIKPASLEQQSSRMVYDQFGRRYLQFFRSVLLGVPSLKSKWREY